MSLPFADPAKLGGGALDTDGSGLRGEAAAAKQVNINVNAVRPAFASTTGKGERNGVVRLVQFQPCWALHAMLRFRSIPYTCEMQELQVRVCTCLCVSVCVYLS